MLPNSGNRLHAGSIPSEAEYIRLVSDALRSELGSSGAAAKTIMRWTGASNRTARNWLSGLVGPSGIHLVCLAGQSNAVLSVLLEMAGRRELSLASDIHAVEVALAKATGAIEILKRQTARDRAYTL